MKIGRSIFILLLLLIGCISINAQKEGCGVTRYFVDLDSEISTSRFSLGQFLIETDDDEVVKYFQDKESGVKLSVGVQKYTSSFKDVPKKIRLRISFTSKPDDNFELLDGAESESIYDKNWKWLKVSNKIEVKNRIYTYEFSCGREIKRNNR